MLVSESVLKRLYDVMMKHESRSFGNAVVYLHMIVKRINSETEDMDYGDQSNKKKDPTMNFETDFLYERIESIVKLIGELHDQVLFFHI